MVCLMGFRRETREFYKGNKEIFRELKGKNPALVIDVRWKGNEEDILGFDFYAYF